ncbi:MAG TPA: hypothetical protein PLQ54_13045, partial [Armatimonadota bacterium]|nr:hypothetical protein [Armatimonadota bacterium]
AARARENLEAGKSMHMKMSLKIEVPVAQVPDIDIEIWRKNDKIRAEMPTMNQVSIVAKDEVFSYQGQAGVMLHVPPETMQQFADQRDAVLEKLGLPKDQDEAFVTLLEKDMATIVGEKEYDDIPCYVLQVKPEYCQAFTESLGMAGAMNMTGGLTNVQFGVLQMALEQETGNLRRLYMEMSLMPPGMTVNVDLKLTVTVLEYELNADIPDAMFEFEAPEGTKIIEFTPDRTIEDVQKELLDAAMAQQQAAAPEL